MAWIGLAVVRGRSMQPALFDGDRLLVRYGRPGRPGDVVVVRLPGRGTSVKRLWRYTTEGAWVERDNPVEGVDSWLVGAIPRGDVLGVAPVRLWPQPQLLRRRRPRPSGGPADGDPADGRAGHRADDPPRPGEGDAENRAAPPASPT